MSAVITVRGCLGELLVVTKAGRTMMMLVFKLGKGAPQTPASAVQDVSVAEEKPQAISEVGGDEIAPPAQREQPTGKWPQDVQPRGQV